MKVIVRAPSWVAGVFVGGLGFAGCGVPASSSVMTGGSSGTAPTSGGAGGVSNGGTGGAIVATGSVTSLGGSTNGGVTSGGTVGAGQTGTTGGATVVNGGTTNGGMTSAGAGGVVVVAGAGGSGSGGVPVSSGGSGGIPATGGTPATGGAAGSTGGTVTGTCTFTATSSTSKAIPTVGIVEWTTSLGKVDSAQIEFTLVGPKTNEINLGGVAPVDLTKANYRTLLLGLKGARDYTYHIVATGGGTKCQSQDFTFKTGAVANSVPVLTRQLTNATARARGFILTSAGIGSGFGTGSSAPAFILDSDGDVVWWASPPSNCSRIHMNYEGTDMWMMELNVDNSGGEMRRVSMDGLDVQNNVTGLSAAHHDFTVLPGGIVATVSWTKSGMDPPSNLIERSPDGTIKTVRVLDSTAYASGSFHSNAIHYRPADDTYTLGDRNPNLFIKIKRTGELLWQFGGNCSGAPAPKCAAGNWQVNHGHQLLADGHFLFFNNGAMGSMSAAFEYTLAESGNTLTATQVWKYQPSGVSSNVLGDIQRLPNGNTLITYSTQGVIHEIDASRNLVQSFTTQSVGYAEFREKLYGPPL